MFVSISFDEIKTFPKEVRLFLKSYFEEKLSENLKDEKEIFRNTKSTLSKTPNIVEAPNFTRHPSRKLIATNKINWFKFLSKIIEDEDGKNKNDFHFTILPNNNTEVLFNSNGNNIIH